MASLRTFTARGFTLVEVLVVMGMFVIIASLGLIVSFDDYRSFNFRNERDIVIAALQKARSQAINNMCFGASCTDGKPHGVYLGTAGHYIVFQGASYAARDAAVDEDIAAKDATSQLSGSQSVVFSEFAGTATPASITVTNAAGRTSVITVESEGRITWTH